MRFRLLGHPCVQQRLHNYRLIRLSPLNFPENAKLSEEAVPQASLNSACYGIPCKKIVLVTVEWKMQILMIHGEGLPTDLVNK